MVTTARRRAPDRAVTVRERLPEAPNITVSALARRGSNSLTGSRILPLNSWNVKLPERWHCRVRHEGLRRPESSVNVPYWKLPARPCGTWRRKSPPSLRRPLIPTEAVRRAQFGGSGVSRPRGFAMASAGFLNAARPRGICVKTWANIRRLGFRAYRRANSTH